MEWPLVNPETGKFSTTPTAKHVWTTAMTALLLNDEDGSSTLSSELRSRIGNWTKSIDSVQNWRSDYIPIIEEFVRIMASVTPELAIVMAQAGLDSLANSLVFRMTMDNNDDTTTVTAKQVFFDEAYNEFWKPIETVTYHGEQSPATLSNAYTLASPHRNNDDGSSHVVLTSPRAATQQLETWVKYGCMESSAAHHASAVCLLPNASTLVQDKIFVLLGATSSMGPAKQLLQIPGAHVLAVARPGQKLQGLIQWFRQTAPQGTTLEIPGKGVDMLQDAPRVARWIVDTIINNINSKEEGSSAKSTHRQVVLCHLAYMDGEAHVRISVAMDLISQYVIAKRPSGMDVALSYITSPATVYAIPREAAMDAQQRYKTRPTWQRLLQSMSLGQWSQPTNTNKDIEGEVDDNELVILNGLASVQGPNYALAKTIQQWRCMVAAESKEKIVVSAPHGPATRTDSMVTYSTIAAALEGMQHLPPLLAFDVEPASSLLAAIMLYQVNNNNDDGDASSSPQHPMKLFWDGSVHGGVWRCPYAVESYGTVSFLLGKTTRTGWCPPESLAPVVQQQEDTSHV